MADVTIKGLKVSGDDTNYLFQASSLVGDVIDTYVWPVGSIFVSLNATPPGYGTWQRVAQGQFLIGASSDYSAGATGGSATLTQVPQHSHSVEISSTTSSNGAHTHKIYLMYDTDASSGSAKNRVTPAPNGDTTSAAGYTTETSSKHTHTVSYSGNTGNTGVSGGVDILPPYLAVYMYQRTA